MAVHPSGERVQAVTVAEPAPGRLRRALTARARHEDAGRPSIVIEPRRGGLLGLAGEFVDNSWLIPVFGRVYLRKRYRRTFLGFLWVPLKPSFNVVSKILVFGGIVGISAGKTPYPIFFLIATASWQLFMEVAMWATRSLEVGRAALTKIELPRLPLIFAALVPGSIEFLVYVGFAVVGLSYYFIRAHVLYVTLGMQTLLVPAGIVLIVLQALGLGLITAGTSGRDLRFSLQFGLSFMYFVTPVLYPLSKIPVKYRPIAELNPLMGSIEMVKDGLFNSHELTYSAVIVALTGAAVLWAFGLWRLERFHSRRALA